MNFRIFIYVLYFAIFTKVRNVTAWQVEIDFGEDENQRGSRHTDVNTYRQQSGHEDKHHYVNTIPEETSIEVQYNTAAIRHKREDGVITDEQEPIVATFVRDSSHTDEVIYVDADGSHGQHNVSVVHGNGNGTLRTHDIIIVDDAEIPLDLESPDTAIMIVIDGEYDFDDTEELSNEIVVVISNSTSSDDAKVTTPSSRTFRTSSIDTTMKVTVTTVSRVPTTTIPSPNTKEKPSTTLASSTSQLFVSRTTLKTQQSAATIAEIASTIPPITSALLQTTSTLTPTISPTISTIAPKTSTISPTISTITAKISTIAPTTSTITPTIIPTISTIAPTIPSTIPPKTSRNTLTTSKIPQSTSTLPPTTSTVPQTTSTLPPTTSTVPQTTSTVPTKTSRITASTFTIPQTTSTIPPTNSTIPSTTSTIPPTTSTVPAKTSRSTASNFTIPQTTPKVTTKKTSAGPVPTTTIPLTTSTIPPKISRITRKISTVSPTTPQVTSTMPPTVPQRVSRHSKAASIFPQLGITVATNITKSPKTSTRSQKTVSTLKNRRSTQPQLVKSTPRWPWTSVSSSTTPSTRRPRNLNSPTPRSITPFTSIVISTNTTIPGSCGHCGCQTIIINNNHYNYYYGAPGHSSYQHRAPEWDHGEIPALDGRSGRSLGESRVNLSDIGSVRTAGSTHPKVQTLSEKKDRNFTENRRHKRRIGTKIRLENDGSGIRRRHSMRHYAIKNLAKASGAGDIHVYRVLKAQGTVKKNLVQNLRKRRQQVFRVSSIIGPKASSRRTSWRVVPQWKIDYMKQRGFNITYGKIEKRRITTKNNRKRGKQSTPPPQITTVVPILNGNGLKRSGRNREPTKFRFTGQHIVKNNQSPRAGRVNESSNYHLKDLDLGLENRLSMRYYGPVPQHLVKHTVRM